MHPSEVGERLKRARELAGADVLSARELGELAGVSAALVGHIERGEVLNPRANTMVSLADVLGVSLEWLMAGRGELPAPTTIRAALDIARERHAEKRAATGTEGR